MSLRERLYAVDMRPVRRDLIAEVKHAPTGLDTAGGAVGLLVLRNPSGNQVPMIEPHRKNDNPPTPSSG